LNFSQFIAKRLRKPTLGSFSATVYKIGVFTIACGVMVLILSYMVLQGFKANVVSRLFSVHPQLKISAYSLSDTFDEKPISSTIEFYKNWKKIEGIDNVYLTAQKSGILKAKDEIQGVIFKGLSKNYNWLGMAEQLQLGKLPTLADSGYSNEVLLSKIVANKLKLQVGEEAVLYFVQNPPKARKIKIAGVFETNLEELDNQIILGDIRLVQRINNWPADSVGSIGINVKNIENLGNVQEKVVAGLPPDLKIESAKAKFAPVFEWLQLLDKNMGLLIVILFFVVGFNVVAVTLVLIMERIPTIGILKALGSQNGQIRRIFVNIGINMVLKGLFWGNLLGLGLGFLQWKYKVIPLDASNYFINYVPIAWHWLSVFLINIGTIAVVALVLLLPTYIIKTIKPIAAIRFG
jgi:lipoprotein-releasing system permease protein